MSKSNTVRNDPLSMPPPYWEDCEAIDQLIRALQWFPPTLNTLSEEIVRIDPMLEEHAGKQEDLGDEFDADGIQYNEILEEYVGLVYALGSYADLATLMAAISTESLINKFCVQPTSRYCRIH